MKLSRLLSNIKPVSLHGLRATCGERDAGIKNVNERESASKNWFLSPDPEIISIHYKAQDVKPGGLFVAIPGLVADGHEFIDEALSKGASVLVTQKLVERESVVIEVENSRKALSTISSRYYSNPSEKLTMIGITGTNGKTTTARLIEGMLLEAGIKAGVIGTLNYRYSGKMYENPMTTPESLDLQKILAEMVNDGITHAVMEVTSHAIDQDRIYDCSFDIKVFTNLSQDHLDYHGDMTSYWLCKKRMFTGIFEPGSNEGKVFAILNHNDERGKELINELEERPGEQAVISVGFSDSNAIWPQDFSYDMTGITGNISTHAGAFQFKSPLVGRYNLENILSTVGVGVALNLSLKTIKAGIEAVNIVPGRLEPIPNDHNRFVYVDYAHTPDALKNVLSALRASAGGRLICVFGCGGNRDKTKRPQMGQIAGKLSDLTVVTSDNPRTEQPLEIINQILEGTDKTTTNAYIPSDLKTGFQKKGYVVEPDRRRAIQLAILVSRPGDTVLIAGKGDETYQIIGDRTIAFDDRKEAEQALSLLNVNGSEIKESHIKEPIHPNPKNNTCSPDLRTREPAPWMSAEILEAARGELLCGDLKRSFKGISIDSRRISNDDLFIAIKGEVHDGHHFIGSVINQGVKGLLVKREKADTLPVLEYQKKKVVCILVKDTTRALGDIAAYNQKRTNVAVIAITGSNGKTSTRKMTAGVVSQRFCTLSAKGNLNNAIGLPLNMLNFNHDHEWAVLELGMNRPGEIERLTEICSPEIGVITNIGPAHLEGLGSIDAVMRAKGELLDKIKSTGTMILNADDQRILRLAKDTSKNILFFGQSKTAEVRARELRKKGIGLSFTLIFPGDRISVDLKTPADFMVSNALAAAAVGYRLGLTPDEIREGLENFDPVKGRMNILKTKIGIHIIDDTYNANPGSMEAAIKTLKILKGNNRGILVAGDMLELGEHAETMHRMIGSIAAKSDISKIYVTGHFAKAVAAGAGDENMDSQNIFTGTKEAILESITDRLNPGDWVLVKGSRGMAMETIVEDLMNWSNQ
jgi:murE/murF fusion protein